MPGMLIGAAGCADLPGDWPLLRGSPFGFGLAFGFGWGVRCAKISSSGGGTTTTRDRGIPWFNGT